MTDPDATRDKTLRELISADLRDSLDEELELEFGESQLEQFGDNQSDQETLERSVYFKELFRLQGELVKLQDWVQHNKLQVVVIFEGRTPLARAALSSVLPNVSIRAFAVSRPCQHRTNASARSGTFNVMRHICPPVVKSSCSTVPGTTAPALSALWAFAPRTSARSSFVRCPSSSACWCAQE